MDRVIFCLLFFSSFAQSTNIRADVREKSYPQIDSLLFLTMPYN